MVSARGVRIMNILIAIGCLLYSCALTAKQDWQTAPETTVLFCLVAASAVYLLIWACLFSRFGLIHDTGQVLSSYNTALAAGIKTVLTISALFVLRQYFGPKVEACAPGSFSGMCEFLTTFGLAHAIIAMFAVLCFPFAVALRRLCSVTQPEVL